MGSKADQESFLWVPEYDEPLSPQLTNLKRRGRSKKVKFDGWGSIPLIEFLQSLGKDTTQQISRYDVTDIINKYVNENKLVHSVKKKRVVSDERLLSLFGKKSFLRIKIYDLLEAHYAENQFESDDDFLFSSDEENNLFSSEKQKSRKVPLKKLCLETPKSCWAAIVPDNIKLVYLKRSLVQDLLKDSETFECKVVGSFVRVKSDPNDYLQKNSHQLLQVIGTKKVPGTDDKSTEILLKVSNFVKDIRIATLSDDNFSEEECEDLRQRVKDGLLKRPTVQELMIRMSRLSFSVVYAQESLQHFVWLGGAFERPKGGHWSLLMLIEAVACWYLERRQLLQTPVEQERLLLEIPKIIGDEELEALPLESPDNTEKGHSGFLIPIPNGPSEGNIAVDATRLPLVFPSTGSAGIQAALPKSEQLTEKENGLHLEFVAENELHFEFAAEPQKVLMERRSESKVVTPLVEIEDNKIAGGLADTQVIDLSDGEENDDLRGDNQMRETDLRRLAWHYTDPQGDIQGPFSIASLKRWWDDDYFPSDFKVWKSDQGEENAVLLSDVLKGSFPS
ncbi:hypothetical protein KPL71_022338 [Citrus sinensis]|uniref:Uncharacterized protein n=1 Tax=Citrus sinensis TaxID=2711 RepID=A0ACB8JLF4_CITSI|nr:hypothetical protein KPL71_022338 [Citrus sinensis]